MSLTARTFLLTLFIFCFSAAQVLSSPVVLFDESHRQQFTVGKNGPLDLSELAALYEGEGFLVQSRTGSLTPDALSAVAVLVISGPFLPLSDDEVNAVMQFVENGGALAMMLHIAPPLGDLLHRLEVDFTNGTLREVQQVIGGNPLDFKVSDLAGHPVTLGLESFSLYGSWALRGTAPHVNSLAQTSKHGWVDLDRDNRPSQADAMQPFTVMVAGELGQGRYVVVGDDAVFQNRYLDEANRQLARQMLEWLSFRR